MLYLESITSGTLKTNDVTIDTDKSVNDIITAIYDDIKAHLTYYCQVLERPDYPHTYGEWCHHYKDLMEQYSFRWKCHDTDNPIIEKLQLYTGIDDFNYKEINWISVYTYPRTSNTDDYGHSLLLISRQYGDKVHVSAHSTWQADEERCHLPIVMANTHNFLYGSAQVYLNGLLR